MSIQVEVISNEVLECGEGPMWDVAGQRLFWTDAHGRSIWEYDRLTAMSRRIGRELHANSIALHASGGLMLATDKGFVRWFGDGNSHVVAGTIDGEPIVLINDIVADSRGRLFGGQQVYKKDEPYDRGYLYRIDLNGTAVIVDEGMGVANGMGFSPDDSTFFLVDSLDRVVYAYDYAADSGDISNRRQLIRVSANEGLPDGLTVDSDGFIWLAMWFGSRISRYDPDGKPAGGIALPVAQISSVMFGGADLNEIYVTSAGSRSPSGLAPPGHDYRSPRGGPTFRITQEVQGRPEHLARVV